jgi:hypothetical protein
VRATSSNRETTKKKKKSKVLHESENIRQAIDPARDSAAHQPPAEVVREVVAIPNDKVDTASMHIYSMCVGR